MSQTRSALCSLKGEVFTIPKDLCPQIIHFILGAIKSCAVSCFQRSCHDYWQEKTIINFLTVWTCLQIESIDCSFYRTLLSGYSLSKKATIRWRVWDRGLSVWAEARRQAGTGEGRVVLPSSGDLWSSTERGRRHCLGWVYYMFSPTTALHRHCWHFKGTLHHFCGVTSLITHRVWEVDFILSWSWWKLSKWCHWGYYGLGVRCQIENTKAWWEVTLSADCV